MNEFSKKNQISLFAAITVIAAAFDQLSKRWALANLSYMIFSKLPGALGQVFGKIPILQVGIPAVFSIYFDIFSSLLQAFIFCMLTMMYIGSAAEE
jgi:lipoprotein signal peptidase